MDYTISQKKVIRHNITDESGALLPSDSLKNVLVSAGAGSGKTAVLTEHVINIISNLERPVDVDKLLIVTFTKAAAAEMSERISKAISKKIKELVPGSALYKHLCRQQALISHAHISTIDSFCSWVVKNYFEKIDIDPGYRYVEDKEMILYAKDAFTALMDKKFEEGDPAFMRFMESHSLDKNEDNIFESLKAVYDKSMSMAYPDAFIDELIEKAKTKYTHLGELPYMHKYVSDVRAGLSEFLVKAKDFDGLLELQEGKYLIDIRNIENLLAIMADAPFVLDFLRFSFETKKRKTKTCDNNASDIAYCELCDEFKNFINKKKEMLAGTSSKIALTDDEIIEKILEINNKANEDVVIFLELLNEYIEVLADLKREDNVVEISDVAHFALEILAHDEVRADIASKFEEILIDEYQDSNELQEAILTSFSRGHNMFMVGDVKQSIYGFRFANPKLFSDKYDAYSELDGGYKIDLQENFRCRVEVIDAVNEIFERIMTRDFCGTDYSLGAQLIYGADGIYSKHDPGDDTYKAEFISVDDEGIGAGEAVRLQAEYTAARIKELVGPSSDFQVYDKEAETFRKATYKDIVVLGRGKNELKTFEKVLEKAGIPAVSTVSTGYFDSSEVKLILSALNAIDNPRQDVPLLALMVSPICGFTNAEVALIKAMTSGKKRDDFYDRLRDLKDDDKKVEDFLKWLDNYREFAKHHTILEIINKLLMERGFEYYLRALVGGENRLANIEKLKMIASDYEKTSYSGIFDFNRYVSLTKKYNIDDESASILSEANDVVRLMTIHKSKGLEFPVVFLAACAKKFKSSKSDEFTLREGYVSTKYVDVDRHAEYSNFSKAMLTCVENASNEAEEMRLFYVAMTRAREKLIMLTHRKIEVDTDTNEPKPLDDNYILGLDQLSSFEIEKMSSYEDFVRYSVPEDSYNFIFEAYSKDGLREYISSVDESNKEYIENMKEPGEGVDITFDYDLPYHNASAFGIKGSYSVSDIKKLSMEQDGQEEENRGKIYNIRKGSKARSDDSGVKSKPGHGLGTDLSSLVGTAYHRVFEKLDPALGDDEAHVQSIIDKYHDIGYFEDAVYERLDAKKISAFYKDELGKHVADAYASGKVLREQAFVLGADASEVKKDDALANVSEGKVVADISHQDTSLANMNEDKVVATTTQPVTDDAQIIIQGIIDLCIIYDDHIELYDYKSDRIKAGEEEKLAKRYDVQLYYYTRALEEAYGKKVTKKYLYSIELEKFIEVPC